MLNVNCQPFIVNVIWRAVYMQLATVTTPTPLVALTNWPFRTLTVAELTCFGSHVGSWNWLKYWNWLMTTTHYSLPITYTTGQHIWKPFTTHTHAHAHTHTQPFYRPFFGTTRVRRCPTNLMGFFGAREDNRRRHTNLCGWAPLHPD